MSTRIAFDVTSLSYPNTGLARVTQSLLTALNALGLNQILAPFARSLTRKVKLRDAGLEVHQLYLPRRAEAWIRRLGLIEWVTQPELVHATDHFLPVKRETPTVATIHDTLYFSHFNPDWEAHRHFRSVLPSFAPRCRAIITCSEHSKKDIVRYLGVHEEHVHVIPWGVDHELFRPAGDAGFLRAQLHDSFGLKRPYFFVVGCDTQRKNTPRILRVFSRMLKEGCDTDLVLAWEPPADLRERYQSERIHFLSGLPSPALAQLYQGAVALLYPSLYEGFGLPVLEAMACGTAVLTSSRSSLPEVAGDAAVYVNPEDDDSVLSGMGQLLDKASRAALRRKGLERAAEFSWNTCAERTVKVYEHCIGRELLI